MRGMQCFQNTEKEIGNQESGEQQVKRKDG